MTNFLHSIAMWAMLAVQLMLLGRAACGLCGFAVHAATQGASNATRRASGNMSADPGGRAVAAAAERRLVATPFGWLVRWGQTQRLLARLAGRPRAQTGPEKWLTAGTVVGLVLALVMVGARAPAWGWPAALAAAAALYVPCPRGLRRSDGWDGLRLPAAVIAVPLIFASWLAVLALGLAALVALVILEVWALRFPLFGLGQAGALIGLWLGGAAALYKLLHPGWPPAAGDDVIKRVGDYATPKRLLQAGPLLGLTAAFEFWRHHVLVPRASVLALGCVLGTLGWVLLGRAGRKMLETLAKRRGSGAAKPKALGLLYYMQYTDQLPRLVLVAGLAGAGAGAVAMPPPWRWAAAGCAMAALLLGLSKLPVPTTPEQIHKTRWASFAVLVTAVFALGVDHTILNVALPTMRIDLHLSASQSTWLVDGFLLPFVGMLLTLGGLGDRFGRRPSLFAGLLVFAGGAAMAASMRSAAPLIAARFVMGFGAAAIMPVTLSTFTVTFTTDKSRRLVIGLWSGIGGLGLVVGPVIGGWLIAHWGWPAIFIVNIPVAGLALAFGWKVVPESKGADRLALDPLGAVLSLTALLAIVGGIIEAPQYGWTDLPILVAFGVGVTLLGGFLLWEGKSANPMLDLKLFRNRNFTAASLTISLIYFALAGTLYLLASYLQDVRGYTPQEAGVRFLPVAALIVAAVVAPQVAGKLGTRAVVAGGLATIAAGLGLMSRVNVHTHYDLVALCLFLGGAGMGMAVSPATHEIMQALPPARTGVASALNDTTRLLGSALGVAVMSTIADTAYRHRMSAIVGHLPASASPAGDSVDAALVISRGLGSAGAGLREVAFEAYVHAMAVTMVSAACVLGVAVILVTVFLGGREAQSSSGAE